MLGKWLHEVCHSHGGVWGFVCTLQRTSLQKTKLGVHFHVQLHISAETCWASYQWPLWVRFIQIHLITESSLVNHHISESSLGGPRGFPCLSTFSRRFPVVHISVATEELTLHHQRQDLREDSLAQDFFKKIFHLWHKKIICNGLRIPL